MADAGAASDAGQVIAVLEWIAWWHLNPYQNAKPIADLGQPWWFARIPGGEHNGTVCACTMRIDEERLESVCSHFATLTIPL